MVPNVKLTGWEPTPGTIAWKWLIPTQNAGSGGAWALRTDSDVDSWVEQGSKRGLRSVTTGHRCFQRLFFRLFCFFCFFCFVFGLAGKGRCFGETFLTPAAASHGECGSCEQKQQ